MLALLCMAAAANGASDAGLHYAPNQPQTAFAATEIHKAYAAAGKSIIESGLTQLANDTLPLRIVIAADPQQAAALARTLGVAPMKNASAQSYSIRRQVKPGAVSIAVLAADATGAMYGGLDIAEAVQPWHPRRPGRFGPRSAHHRRGIKFNVPLDARTPSYSDNSDAAQKNIPEMWEPRFLARLSRRNGAPSLQRALALESASVPFAGEGPRISRCGARRYEAHPVPMDDTFSLNGTDMVRPDLLAHLETVKKMPIEDKIEFWRTVMQSAHDRGIEVYWFTWNIFTWGAEGKYGITSKQDNQNTIDYFRASVRELVLTYPLLAGIGITAGEHMEERKDEFSKEKWLWNTYGRGIVDALRKCSPAATFA